MAVNTYKFSAMKIYAETIIRSIRSCRAISRVTNGESLSAVLPQIQEQFAAKDQPLLAELCYGTLRYYFRLSAWSKLLLESHYRIKSRKF